MVRTVQPSLGKVWQGARRKAAWWPIAKVESLQMRLLVSCRNKISFLSFLWPPDSPELGLKTGIQATWLLCCGVRQLWERLPRAISRALSSFAIIQSARTHPTLAQKQEAQMLETGQRKQTLSDSCQTAETVRKRHGSCRNVLPLTDWAIRSSETHRRALGMKARLKKS